MSFLQSALVPSSFSSLPKKCEKSDTKQAVMWVLFIEGHTPHVGLSQCCISIKNLAECDGSSVAEFFGCWKLRATRQCQWINLCSWPSLYFSKVQTSHVQCILVLVLCFLKIMEDQSTSFRIEQPVLKKKLSLNPLFRVFLEIISLQCHCHVLCDV